MWSPYLNVTADGLTIYCGTTALCVPSRCKKLRQKGGFLIKLTQCVHFLECTRYPCDRKRKKRSSGMLCRSVDAYIFTARCYAERGYATVILSVCLSIHPSVTFRYAPNSNQINLTQRNGRLSWLKWYGTYRDGLPISRLSCIEGVKIGPVAR